MIIICLTLLILTYASNLRGGSGALRWMLTEEEIKKSRGGHERNDITVFTDNNDVEFLIDGKNFYDRLYIDMLRTGKGDSMHGMLFHERTGIYLKPDPDNLEEAEKTTFKNIVKDAIQRGVDIRLLVNCNVVEAVNALPFCIEMNWICGYTCCGLDTRQHNWLMGNLHTKYWVIKTSNESIVYNTGMDIGLGRWDTPKHDNSRARQMNGNFLGTSGYHDSAVRLRGPSVIDYERHFHQSWNDPYPAMFPFHNLPKYDWVEPPYAMHKESGFQIQLLRTVGCKGAMKGCYQSFAPRGEASSYFGLKKLVEQAREFLYLEDQFLNYPEIMRVIKNRLPELKFVILVTNDQAMPAVFSNERYAIQYQALNILFEDKELAKKVHLFNMVRDTDPTEFLYMHAKLFIADDEYMITGSFGVERSCFTNDQDLGVGLYEKSGKFIKEVRKRLWTEHLMLPQDNHIVDDPIKGLMEWERQAIEGKNRVRRYIPKNTEWTFLTSLVHAVYETDGSCYDDLH